jgi:hypothetical protein
MTQTLFYLCWEHLQIRLHNNSNCFIFATLFREIFTPQYFIHYININNTKLPYSFTFTFHAMKRFVPVLLLLSALSSNAQDFTASPYQDFAMSDQIAADFNGDGKPDILGIKYAPNPNQVAILLNGGTSPISFSKNTVTPNMDGFGLSAAADMDGDGDMDVVIAKSGSLDLYMLQNDGAANFTQIALGVSGASILKVADFDQDNDLDIAGINPDNNTSNLYINDGTQHFTAKNILTTTDDLAVFDIGDMDNDGDWDIVLGFDQFSGNQVVVYKNVGNNNFEKVTAVSNQISSMESLQVFDINNDGKKDVLTAGGFSVDAVVNQGNLAFQRKDLSYPFNPIRSAVGGDYNGDGKPDYAVGTNSDAIYWYKNLSNATLTFETHNVGGVTPTFSMVNADLDQDGDLDIVVSNGEFWWYENNLVQEPSSTLNFAEKSVSIFPNPFSDRIQIKHTELGIYELTLTDMLGRKVYTAQLNSEFADLSHLKPGFYVLSLMNIETQQVKSTTMIKE